MPEHSVELADVAAAISDRRAIDWVAREQRSRGGNERALLGALKLIDQIGRFHREGLVGAPVGDVDTDPDDASVASSRWADLELREIIGRGAFGVVHRAFDAKLARFVAVKLWPDEQEGSRGAIEEGRLLARIRHPHVVMVFGADRREGQVGVWMELITGQTLECIVRTQGPFSPREAALIGIDLCNALAAIHRAGLLHRDVKAQNVMREQGGRIVLMDLGAGLEQPHDDNAPVDTAGTPLYMAPEILAGARPSVRSDLYSVGMLLFRLVTGSHAVEAKSVRDLRDAHAAHRRRPLREVRAEVPVAFEEVVERSLAFDPADRYESASAMEYGLMAAVGLVAAPAVRAATAARPWQRLTSGRSPAWLTAVLLVATVVITAGVTTVVDRWRSPSPSSAPAAQATATKTEAPTTVVPLTDDERRIWMGYEELAASHAVEGHWAEAEALYARIYPIFYKKWGPDTPMLGYSMARQSWMAHLAGHDAEGVQGFDVPLYKLEQELGPEHPYAITTLMAKAAFLQDQQRYADAAAALPQALLRRGRLMRRLGGASGGRLEPLRVVTPEQWVPILQRNRIAADSDGDWIPDAVEVAIGTDPNTADTDGDGIPDGDEDSDHDGWPNCADYCQGWDPTRVIAQAGAVNPVLLGFNPVRSFTAGRTAGSTAAPGWNMATTSQAYYSWPLPSALKRLALDRGWRYISAGVPREGTSWVQLDLSPTSGRWDVGVARLQGGGVQARVIASVLPLEGPVFDAAVGDGWGPLGLQYDPVARSARLLLNWRPRASGFRGHQQFLEGLGVVFGSHTAMGQARGGKTDFFFASFEIR